MHGSIRRTPGVYAEHNEGSSAPVRPLIRRIRAENPNTLLLDCGDIFQGTAESYPDARRRHGHRDERAGL